MPSCSERAETICRSFSTKKAFTAVMPLFSSCANCLSADSKTPGELGEKSCLINRLRACGDETRWHGL